MKLPRPPCVAQHSAAMSATSRGMTTTTSVHIIRTLNSSETAIVSTPVVAFTPLGRRWWRKPLM